LRAFYSPRVDTGAPIDGESLHTWGHSHSCASDPVEAGEELRKVIPESVVNELAHETGAVQRQRRVRIHELA